MSSLGLDAWRGPSATPTLTVKRAGELLGLSRSAAYRAAATGELPTLAFGRRLVVPTFRLLEMLGLPVEGRR